MVAAAIDYRRLADRAVLLYVLSVVALVYVLRFAPVIAGTRRWVVIGGFQLQPSELVKLAAAVFVAKIFSEYRQETPRPARRRPARARRWGSSRCSSRASRTSGPRPASCRCFLAVAFLAGLRMRAVVGLAAVMLLARRAHLALPARTTRRRASTPSSTPRSTRRGPATRRSSPRSRWARGASWAGASCEGSQAQLGYLPARHTDFIFSVLAEEMGFVGVVVVLAPLPARCCGGCSRRRGSRATGWAPSSSPASRASFAFQVVYNVAMVAGLVPVKGLPLPLMSYGGSSMLSSLMGIGLILSVRMRRFAN